MVRTPVTAKMWNVERERRWVRLQRPTTKRKVTDNIYFAQNCHLGVAGLETDIFGVHPFQRVTNGIGD